MGKIIYFDNAATSFPKPECVADAMKAFICESAGNPGRAGHGLARRAAIEVDETRESLSKFLGVSDASRLVFTLNATDALNIALSGVLKPGDHVVASAVEHNSVVRPLKMLENRGVSVSYAEGMSVDAFEASANEHTRLFVCAHASNVTGQVFSVDELSMAAHKRGALMLVDGAQTVGHMPVDVEKLGADLFAFSGHKGLLGPTGTGGLYVRDGVDVTPYRLGGTGLLSESDEQPAEYPYRLESGTQNTVGIAGMRAAISFILQRGMEKIVEEQNSVMDMIMDGLSHIPGVSIVAGHSESHVPLVSIVMDGVDVHDAAAYVDARHGVCVRAGLHCAPRAHMHTGTYPSGTLRISAGIFNSSGDVDVLLKGLKEAVSVLKR